MKNHTLELSPLVDSLFEVHGSAEFVHYYDSSNSNLIYQRCNTFVFRLDDIIGSITLPLRTSIISKFSRMARRLLRTDKGSCIWIKETGRLIIFYQSKIYTYDVETRSILHESPINFRNPLYSGVLQTDKGHVYFGEYRGNWQLEEINIYRSTDSGDSWHIIHTFPPGSIFHVHSLMWDPYEEKIWVFTGDFDGQCKVCVADIDFSNVETLGDGSQKWRAVNALFLEDKVVWGMDSPLSDVTINSLDRKTRTLTAGQSLDGPVWFSKALEGGGALMQTTVEHLHLPGVKSSLCSVYFSENCQEWTKLASWEKDRYPNKYFRHGLVAFAEGPQTLDDAVLNGEALKGIDGQSFKFSINSVSWDE